MLFKTHLAFGILLGLLIYGLSFNSFIFITIVAIAALLPDIDIPGSFIGRRAKIVSWSIKLFFEHRGFTHSLLFVFILAALGLVFFPAYVVALLIGYGSHVLLDCLTKDGVRIFWPLRFRLRGCVRTGGLVERVFVWGVVIGVVVLVVKDSLYLFV